jgi:hypothetical protein
MTMHTSYWTAATALFLAAITVIPMRASEADGNVAVPDRSTAARAIDLRDTFRRYGLETGVQGKRGTCSVFAVTGALEYALARRERHGTRLSVEFLNWASNDAVGEAEDGGFFSDLWKGFEMHGICREEEMPYQGEAFDPDRVPSAAARQSAAALRTKGFRLHWIKPWDPNKGLTETEFQAIRRALTRRWPVCCGMLWPKAQQWQDEVLQMAPREGVRDGHSVLLVGFEDDDRWPGGGRILTRNSNHRGDCYLTYEYVRAYTNDAVWIDFESSSATSSVTAPLGELLSLRGQAPRGRNRRVSSNQQPEWNTENLDMNWLQPGQSVEVPLLKGPGLIHHLWFTSHAGWAGELNALTLRIYWDGREQPGVEVPLGDFFAVGQGKPAPVESIPVQVSPSGSLSCYWRMPFHESARIVITNDNPDRSTGLYWQIDWLQLESLEPETPYFHARYRCEFPAVAGRDYLIADLAGRGQYVGTVMSVTMAQDGWFGEGDDFFFIDGEEVPSLQGTGSEDYFNDAWGFRARTGPWCGQPRWQGEAAGDSGVCYRWHLLDPVNFEKSLRVVIEHKGNRPDSEDGFFLERPDFLSSVAFWYQTGEPRKWEPLPDWHQRRVPWQSQHLVRTLRQARTTTDDRPLVQTVGFFGARPILTWSAKKPLATLTVPFAAPAAARYALRLTAAYGPDYGAYDILLDGAVVKHVDFHMGEFSEADLLLGTHELSQGTHELSFRVPASGGGTGALAVEVLRLLPLPPEANRTVRTHHEAHFIRLGIGRAVYAYRLAYDELPDSLATLVKCGMMPPRYLADENNVPLNARRDGEFFRVESRGPGGWKHQWQGLDARR